MAVNHFSKAGARQRVVAFRPLEYHQISVHLFRGNHTAIRKLKFLDPVRFVYIRSKQCYLVACWLTEFIHQKQHNIASNTRYHQLFAAYPRPKYYPIRRTPIVTDDVLPVTHTKEVSIAAVIAAYVVVAFTAFEDVIQATP